MVTAKVTTKIDRKLLRRKMAAKEIFSFVELARRAECSVTTVYLATERPSRFPKAFSRIKKIVDVKDDLEITRTIQKEDVNV